MVETRVRFPNDLNVASCVGPYPLFFGSAWQDVIILSKFGIMGVMLWASAVFTFRLGREATETMIFLKGDVLCNL